MALNSILIQNDTNLNEICIYTRFVTQFLSDTFFTQFKLYIDECINFGTITLFKGFNGSKGMFHFPNRRVFFLKFTQAESY